MAVFAKKLILKRPYLQKMRVKISMNVLVRECQESMCFEILKH